MELPPRWQVSKTDPAASTAPPRARVHFVGIGGAGLSALALLALRHGWFVSGSDRAASARAETLREAGATVMCGDHTSANLRQGGSGLPDVVVASSAVPRTNPELLAARALGVPVVGRDEWLAFVTRGHALLAVAGTHGKTTTSAMLAVALRDGGERPVTAVVGGDVPQLPGGTNAVADAGHARGDPFVLEADEYDGAFLKLDPLVAVINNVEWDHVDIYDSEDAVHAAFARFASRVRPGGALLACGDNAGALRVADETRERLEARASDEVEGGRQASQVRTFGTAEGNDYRASELETNSVGGTDFVLTHAGEQLCEVSLPVPGMHNVRNACAAVVTAALAAELRGEDATAAASGAARALGDFRGVGRRFEVVGAARSAGVAAVVDDYAHHPTEVIATLQGARQRYPGRPLWAVFQPHTHARLATFEDDFVVRCRSADAHARARACALSHACRSGMPQLWRTDARAVPLLGACARAHPRGTTSALPLAGVARRSRPRHRGARLRGACRRPRRTRRGYAA